MRLNLTLPLSKLPISAHTLFAFTAFGITQSSLASILTNSSRATWTKAACH